MQGTNFLLPMFHYGISVTFSFLSLERLTDFDRVISLNRNVFYLQRFEKGKCCSLFHQNRANLKFHSYLSRVASLGYFGGRAGIITFEMLRFVTLRYGTLLYVTSHCITIVFYAFFFVFTVENKKQCEQDRIRDERQHSEKPSRVVDRSFLILPRTLRKKKEIICTDSDSKKKNKRNS